MVVLVDFGHFVLECAQPSHAALGGIHLNAPPPRFVLFGIVFVECFSLVQQLND